MSTVGIDLDGIDIPVVRDIRALRSTSMMMMMGFVTNLIDFGMISESHINSNILSTSGALMINQRTVRTVH